MATGRSSRNRIPYHSGSAGKDGLILLDQGLRTLHKQRLVAPPRHRDGATLGLIHPTGREMFDESPRSLPVLWWPEKSPGEVSANDIATGREFVPSSSVTVGAVPITAILVMVRSLTMTKITVWGSEAVRTDST